MTAPHIVRCNNDALNYAFANDAPIEKNEEDVVGDAVAAVCTTFRVANSDDNRSRLLRFVRERVHRHRCTVVKDGNDCVTEEEESELMKLDIGEITSQSSGITPWVLPSCLGTLDNSTVIKPVSKVVKKMLERDGID